MNPALPAADRRRPLTPGERFGRLAVVAKSEGRHGKRFWLCECDCGASTRVAQASLKRGTTSSCGCLHRERTAAIAFKHGDTVGRRRTTEHRIWSNMLDRCEREKSQAFPDYGGRGIKVCARWHEFANFLADMGRRPRDLTIDRIDNDRGYSCGKCEDCIARVEPANCRWATRREQCQNRRKALRVEFRGEHLALVELARRFGVVCYYTARHRIQRLGWSVEEAVTLPPSPARRGSSLRASAVLDDVRGLEIAEDDAAEGVA